MPESTVEATSPAKSSASDIPREPTTAELIADLEHRRLNALQAGSARSVDRQHGNGKMTARERLDLLLDPGSFVELDELVQHRASGMGLENYRPLGDGVVTGTGTVDGRTVCVFAQDFTVFGGSLGEAFGQKVIKVMDLAQKIGCPLIGLNDSSGARIQEGVDSLAFYGEIGRRTVLLSGVVPQIALIMGPCAGGAVYTPMGSDLVAMVDKTSHMFITGPEVVAAVTGEKVTLEELGGGHTNAAVAGNVHHLAPDEKDALDWARTMISFLPSNNLEDAPRYASEFEPELTPADWDLDSIVPDARNRAYEMEDVLRHVLDGREFVELQPLFGRSIITGFGRVDGRSVGVVANQPKVNAGTLDIDASEKAARFVRTCNAFNVPILTFVDVPGYMPGVEQERAGIIRRGSKLAFAYAEATVPKVTVVVRKAYGGGYAVMGSKHLGADVNLAWPTAEIAVMGGVGAVQLLFRKDLAKAREEGNEAEVRARLIELYNEQLANPYVAASRGYVDAVIAPRETRLRVAQALATLENKRVALPPKKLGNIPL
jgi:propionyl-CoA carboxylase beta chain